MFSVVIPTHESRDLVVAAIRSVLAQSDQDFEVVVIDNGSTDGTRDAVGELGDSRITYRWQEDSGLPADSRNQGIALARGEWIAFLDADDAWLPQKLTRVRAALQADSGLDALCHDVRITGPLAEHLGERAYRLDDRPIWDQLLYRGNFFTTSAMTVRTSAIRAVGGFDTRADYFTVEDYDLWLRLAASGSRFGVVPEVLGTYLVHPGGASSRLTRHYDALARVFDHHALSAARAGSLDLRAAITRRRRSRLAEFRDLARGGAFADAAAVLLRLPAETSRARRSYREAAASFPPPAEKTGS